VSEQALWHDVECAAYRADLPLWGELAAEAAGPVLELGCGTGRVALELAARGIAVTGVDIDPVLVAALRSRAQQRGLEVEALVGDARELALGREFALMLAPMQFVHLLGGPTGRTSMLRCARAHLRSGGGLAAALLGEDAVGDRVAADADGGPGPLPDVRERDGWVYSSLPVGVERLDGRLEVRRLRQVVSPHGELSEELDVTSLDLVPAEQLETEAAAAGFRVLERVEVPPTRDHVGSTVVVLETR